MRGGRKQVFLSSAETLGLLRHPWNKCKVTNFLICSGCLISAKADIPQRAFLYFHGNMKCNEAMDLEILTLSSWLLGNGIFAMGAKDFHAVTVKLIVMIASFPLAATIKSVSSIEQL